ncbi:hypothetical protein CSB93_5109 [Pseudomonas paraeruginosa]|uniref:Uncharacterized protein n=1 Tax=Pseudomonas paraeruginosa TaxID=2994495 RepID=A0A2R3INW3_9PSED|nr:hypothetical protein CSB93_5109 [Pseudomonas paraeruginosa]AWE95042.1 hypothetical protein CSC28_3901 [Pseudomonas paraeruginosa]
MIVYKNTDTITKCAACPEIVHSFHKPHPKGLDSSRVDHMDRFADG